MKTIKRLTDKTLRQEFDKYNQRFFEGKLGGGEVRFKKMARADGIYNLNTRNIYIDAGLKRYPTLASITLLHEMAHAYLELKGYVGCPGTDGHGMLFQVEINRLYQAGGYDNLL